MWYHSSSLGLLLVFCVKALGHSDVPVLCGFSFPNMYIWALLYWFLRFSLFNFYCVFQPNVSFPQRKAFLLILTKRFRVLSCNWCVTGWNFRYLIFPLNVIPLWQAKTIDAWNTKALILVFEGFYLTSLTNKKSRDQGSSRKISSFFYLFIYMTRISGA